MDAVKGVNDEEVVELSLKGAAKTANSEASATSVVSTCVSCKHHIYG